MERLTQHGFDYCAEYCANSADCGFFKHDVATPCADASIYNRLAAYEDTGLEPEKIEKANKVIVSAFNLAANSGTDMLIERLKEIIRAEAEGRLLVLPCKVGDELWFEKNGLLRCETVDRVQVDQTDIDDGWYVSICTMSVSVLAEDIGRLVWLTREAAETALKERENDG